MVVMQAISQSLEKLYKWVLTELSNADSNDVYTVRIVYIIAQKGIYHIQLVADLDIYLVVLQ